MLRSFATLAYLICIKLSKSRPGARGQSRPLPSTACRHSIPITDAGLAGSLNDRSRRARAARIEPVLSFEAVKTGLSQMSVDGHNRPLETRSEFLPPARLGRLVYGGQLELRYGPSRPSPDIQNVAGKLPFASIGHVF